MEYRESNQLNRMVKLFKSHGYQAEKVSKGVKVFYFGWVIDEITGMNVEIKEFVIFPVNATMEQMKEWMGY